VNRGKQARLGEFQRGERGIGWRGRFFAAGGGGGGTGFAFLIPPAGGGGGGVPNHIATPPPPPNSGRAVGRGLVFCWRPQQKKKRGGAGRFAHGHGAPDQPGAPHCLESVKGNGEKKTANFQKGCSGAPEGVASPRAVLLSPGRLGRGGREHPNPVLAPRGPGNGSGAGGSAGAPTCWATRWGGGPVPGRLSGLRSGRVRGLVLIAPLPWGGPEAGFGGRGGPPGLGRPCVLLAAGAPLLLGPLHPRPLLALHARPMDVHCPMGGGDRAHKGPFWGLGPWDGVSVFWVYLGYDRS